MIKSLYEPFHLLQHFRRTRARTLVLAQLREPLYLLFQQVQDGTPHIVRPDVIHALEWFSPNQRKRTQVFSAGKIPFVLSDKSMDLDNKGFKITIVSCYVETTIHKS